MILWVRYLRMLTRQKEGCRETTVGPESIIVIFQQFAKERGEIRSRIIFVGAGWLRLRTVAWSRKGRGESGGWPVMTTLTLIGVANYCRCKSIGPEEENACTLSVSLDHALAGLRVAALSYIDNGTRLYLGNVTSKYLFTVNVSQCCIAHLLERRFVSCCLDTG